jgi:hypothetical protein
MGTPLKVKLRTGALAFTGLTALLGGTTSNLFRWYDTQLVAGQNGGGWPAVVVRVISDPQAYVFTSQLATSFARVEFTIWSTDPIVNEDVYAQLNLFLNQFNAIGIPGLVQYPCQIVNARDGLLPNEQPPQFLKTVDAKIFSNSSI